MKADAKTEAAVMVTVNRFFEMYAKRDLKGLLSVVAPESDAVFFGSGPDEKYVGLEQAKKGFERDFAQSQAASWELGWHSVSASGLVAWLAAEVIIHATAGGKVLSIPYRLTMVLTHRGSEWILVQLHLSAPSAEQAAGQSWPA